MHNQRTSKKRIDALVHSFLLLFARAQVPCVILSSSNTTNILDNAGTRIGFVKRSYKGGRMYTPLRIIKQCLPTIIILNSLLLHHKPTYVTLTVNERILFFFFFHQTVFVYYHIMKLTLDRATFLLLSFFF
jgi:hypothetical protein